VCNRSPDKVDATVARAKAEGDLPLKGYKDPKEFIQVISKNRIVLMITSLSFCVSNHAVECCSNRVGLQCYVSNAAVCEKQLSS
jgi:hypothetical protein